MDLSEFHNKKYVVHYTKLTRLIENILPKNEIKISNVCNTNDPYESARDWLDAENVSMDIESLNDNRKLTKKIQEKLSKNIKIFCTTHTEDTMSSQISSNHIYCRPRMWSQYGDNHKGACLIFDKDELDECLKIFNTQHIMSGKVEYPEYMDFIINDYYNLGLQDMNSILNNSEESFDLINRNFYLHSRFFKKHFDWKDENEYRWLIYLNNENDIYVDFKKSLKAIVLGCNINPAYYALFQGNKYDIPIYGLSFDGGKYKGNIINKDNEGRG